MARATVCPVTISEQSVSLSPEPTILQFFFPNTDRPNGFSLRPTPRTALHPDSTLFYLSSYLLGCQETYHQRVVDHNTYGKKKTQNFLQQNARPIANALAHTNELETSCVRKCMLHRMPAHINWLTDITATMGSSTRSTKPQISGTLPVQRFLQSSFFLQKHDALCCYTNNQNPKQRTKAAVNLNTSSRAHNITRVFSLIHSSRSSYVKQLNTAISPFSSSHICNLVSF